MAIQTLPICCIIFLHQKINLTTDLRYLAAPRNTCVPRHNLDYCSAAKIHTHAFKYFSKNVLAPRFEFHLFTLTPGKHSRTRTRTRGTRGQEGKDKKGREEVRTTEVPAGGNNYHGIETAFVGAAQT
jgi:hypothetical protein